RARRHGSLSAGPYVRGEGAAGMPSWDLGGAAARGRWYPGAAHLGGWFTRAARGSNGTPAVATQAAGERSLPDSGRRPRRRIPDAGRAHRLRGGMKIYTIGFTRKSAEKF